MNDTTVTLTYFGAEALRENATDIVTLRGAFSMSEGTRFDVPCMTVDVFDYPYTDFEGDPCRLARFELQLPKVDLCWFPQRTTVWGFMSELRANPKLTRNHDDGGFAYIPEPDKTFRPGLVKLVIDQ